MKKKYRKRGEPIIEGSNLDWKGDSLKFSLQKWWLRPQWIGLRKTCGWRREKRMRGGYRGWSRGGGWLVAGTGGQWGWQGWIMQDLVVRGKMFGFYPNSRESQVQKFDQEMMWSDLPFKEIALATWYREDGRGTRADMGRMAQRLT